jgi:hypothetical protein
MTHDNQLFMQHAAMRFGYKGHKRKLAEYAGVKITTVYSWASGLAIPRVSLQSDMQHWYNTTIKQEAL